jgi:hypothetical protein
MKNYVVAAALGIGSLIIPAFASAQVGPGYYGYGYGPSSVINAWTAGIPLITPGFGQAYGAPASAYDGYYDNYYGGYVGSGPSYYGPATYQSNSYYSQGYGQGGYTQPSNGYYPNTGYLNWVPQNYQYQPNFGGYSQAYMPGYYSNPGNNYWGNNRYY